MVGIEKCGVRGSDTFLTEFAFVWLLVDEKVRLRRMSAKAEVKMN